MANTKLSEVESNLKGLGVRRYVLLSDGKSADVDGYEFTVAVPVRPLFLREKCDECGHETYLGPITRPEHVLDAMLLDNEVCCRHRCAAAGSDVDIILVSNWDEALRWIEDEDADIVQAFSTPSIDSPSAECR